MVDVGVVRDWVEVPSLCVPLVGLLISHLGFPPIEFLCAMLGVASIKLLVC